MENCFYHSMKPHFIVEGGDREEGDHNLCCKESEGLWVKDMD